MRLKSIVIVVSLNFSIRQIITPFIHEFIKKDKNKKNAMNLVLTPNKGYRMSSIPLRVGLEYQQVSVSRNLSLRG